MKEFTNDLNKARNRKIEKYFLTQKYISKLIKNMYLNMIIILMFFVIFNILYAGSALYSTIRIILIIVFMILGILIILQCTKSISRNKAFYYEVTNDALIHFNGKKEFIYPWSEFKSIVRDESKLDMIYPITFKTTSKTLILHKSIENNFNLIKDIVKHTSEFAEIDPKVIEEFK